METSINAVMAPEWIREEPEKGEQCERFEIKINRGVDLEIEQKNI
jgi:hypothetical protein